MTERDHLDAYARSGSNGDFAALVSRHVGVVYGSALRQTRSHALAQEISQAVFLDLALHARKLRGDTQLGSWLCVVTRRVAVDVIRRESRRRRREQTAAELHAMNSDDPTWTRVEPVIDEALAALNEADRRAVLLRFFENRSLQEVGAALGVSDDTAQKRVSRALDRLRDFLRRRGITTTAAALGTGLAASAQVAAPTGVAAGICAAVPLAVAALGGGAAGGALSVFLMTTSQKLLFGSAAAFALGGLVYQGTVIHSQHGRIEALQASLQRSRADAVRLQVAPPAENAPSTPAPTAANGSAPATDAFAVRIDELGRRVTTLREMLALAPEQQIPELERLTDDDWITIAMERDLVTADDFRRSFSALRSKAKMKVWGKIAEALHDYVNGHSGEVPASLEVLRGVLPGPLEVQALARYEVVAHGNILDLEKSTVLIREKPDQVIDPAYEQSIAYSWRSTRLSNPRQESSKVSPEEFRFREAVNLAAVAFQRAHGGKKATTVDEMIPYFHAPADAERFQKQFAAMKRPKQ